VHLDCLPSEPGIYGAENEVISAPLRLWKEHALVVETLPHKPTEIWHKTCTSKRIEGGSACQILASAYEQGLQQAQAEIEPLINQVGVLLRENPLHTLNILEIGVSMGGSLLVWSQLAPVNNTVVGIDLPNGRYGGISYTDTRNQTAKSWHPNLHIIDGDSKSEEIQKKVWKLIPSVDLLFIDGDHTYEGAKADYENYGKLVRPGGMIALHDIADSESHRRQGCGVYKLWTEIKGEKQEFLSGLYWGGVGIVRKA
jgi:predicted O-methyltransferase YrrM